MRGLILRGAQILRPGGLSSPLDAFAGALYATHGTRRLVSTWTGPLVTVRRSSDNATMDVYAAGDGWLDTAALLAWDGSASVYVTRWWDQSGLGRHAEQTTASAQPILVNTGVLITLGAKPALYAPEGAYLTGSGAPPGMPITLITSIYASYKEGGIARRIAILGTSFSISVRAGIDAAFTQVGSVYMTALTGKTYINGALTYNLKGSGSSIRINGSVYVTGDSGTGATSSPWSLLGSSSGAAQSIDGQCGELIILTGSISTDQIKYIETSISTPRGLAIS